MEIGKCAHVGGYVVLRDRDGLRHAIRPASVLAMSDSDPCQDTTVVQLPGARMLLVDEPLETVITWLSSAAAATGATAPGVRRSAVADGLAPGNEGDSC